MNPAERWRENPARALARAGFSQHVECGIHRSESSPEGSFALIPRPVARWAKNYAIITHFMLPLTTFYWSGAHRSDVYKWDAFVTSWRFYNRAWQPQRHDRLPETSGTLWIHQGALTNQRCSLATGCGIIQKSQGCSGGNNWVIACLCTSLNSDVRIDKVTYPSITWAWICDWFVVVTYGSCLRIYFVVTAR